MKMNNCRLCNTELKELHYCQNNNFFDKAFGNKVYEDSHNEKQLNLHYCPECGLVYALNNNETIMKQ